MMRSHSRRLPSATWSEGYPTSMVSHGKCVCVSMCAYVCAYVCMCVCVCACLCVHVCVCMCVCALCMCKCVNVCVCMCVNVCVCMCEDVCVSVAEIYTFVYLRKVLTFHLNFSPQSYCTWSFEACCKFYINRTVRHFLHYLKYHIQLIRRRSRLVAALK